jgi:hypothetical protein
MTTNSGNVYFRANAFVRHSSGTLGVGVVYHGRRAVIQGMPFVNSSSDSRVEAGSNTSTTTLRVVGGDE